MTKKMKGVTLLADWDPRDDYKPHPKDVEGEKTYLGSKVWRNPEMKIMEHDIPEPGPEEVLIEVKACGICGSDVHMAEPDEEGYMLYPGLTGFPSILGHEFSGIVVDSGEEALNKRTNKPFEAGEAVTSEEMLWCGQCKPCADGYPNHCENLDEIGINVDGAMAKYIKVPSNTVWSIESLRKVYEDEKELFKAGSLVEPTSVAYNAVIERGGGIRPGDNAVICGGGPIGQAAIALMKRMGAANVILSEPVEDRCAMGTDFGADYIIDPLEEDFAERVLELTNGQGADIFLEATGLPNHVLPGIEEVIWEGSTLNSTVVIVARADAKLKVTGEVYQVRRANIVGAQGHSGHGTFHRVIQCMSDGMDMTPIITKEISMEEAPEHIKQLRTDRSNCKISVIMD